jgi:hypothetical protein
VPNNITVNLRGHFCGLNRDSWKPYVNRKTGEQQPAGERYALTMRTEDETVFAGLPSELVALFGDYSLGDPIEVTCGVRAFLRDGRAVTELMVESVSDTVGV